MPAPFAAIEHRVNTAALACFSNATVVVGGVEIYAVFSNGHGESLGFIGGGKPQITCASADVTGVSMGTPITVSGIAYTAAEIDPDGTGITVIKLESA